MIVKHWPPHGLRLRTPRLELRPDDDPGLGELVEAARAGVHPADQMPFAVPWTDAAPEHLGGGMLRHFWSERAAVAPERWSLNFLARLGGPDGPVIGTQGLIGVDFAVTREVSTGSWLGRRYQEQGFGTEMRAAVLGLAFDHLGARVARSGAFLDNTGRWRCRAGSVMPTTARRRWSGGDVRRRSSACCSPRRTTGRTARSGGSRSPGSKCACRCWAPCDPVPA